MAIEPSDRFSVITVEIPGEEIDTLLAQMEAEDFSVNPHNRYRGNNRRAEYIRELIRRELNDD